MAFVVPIFSEGFEICMNNQNLSLLLVNKIEVSKIGMYYRVEILQDTNCGGVPAAPSLTDHTVHIHYLLFLIS